MGGYGSGRRYRWDTRDVADDSYCLSINDSHRGGRLEPGCYSLWTWSRGGQPVASISVIAERGLVRSTKAVSASLSRRSRRQSNDAVLTALMFSSEATTRGIRSKLAVPGVDRRC
jgi:hypothetical protein